MKFASICWNSVSNLLFIFVKKLQISAWLLVLVVTLTAGAVHYDLQAPKCHTAMHQMRFSSSKCTENRFRQPGKLTTLKLRLHRHEYEYEYEFESGFRFTSECFANKTTIFHCIANNFTNTSSSEKFNNDVSSDVT